jgi:peroxiredoxin family protein
MTRFDHTSLILMFFLIVTSKVSAQFGYIKKSDLDKVKDSRLVVVLFNDSAYNAAIVKAMEKYWKYSGSFITEYDTSAQMKDLNKKPEHYYLLFSKSKASPRIKLKACMMEEDVNGIVISKKYRKKITPELAVAVGMSSNLIDTFDWYPELVRSVQLLNNYFDLASMAKDDKSISFSTMASNYPAKHDLLNNKKLYVLKSQDGLVGKEDGGMLWDDSFEVIDEPEELYKLILKQNEDAVYFFSTKDEKYCNKMFVLANGSELMHYSSTSSKNDCKCTSKDIKALKALKDKANK